ncbi:hypothetical protein QAD02_019981 [Eretmocerus hayati]|uniref:Uncharacterized protein n=1 Tax=Eretmocerus hayati TaxID=131215 RepID=A0ACC2PKR7_9HYME|nr:hypothetical protein QAD02_019981 [Eretmocerus hayati]
MAPNLKVDDCCCPPMTSSTPVQKSQDKYFHEVGAEMTGNQLIIRMQKDKLKNKKNKKNWHPPCDCDVIEIKRPTSTRGPKIVNGGDNNQILFRINSKTHLNKKDDPYYKPQAIAYKINRSGIDENSSCRKVTVYPQLGGPISQEVYTDHISDCDHDVYLLRVKKKNDSPENQGKRNLEVELRTPKPPPKCPPQPECDKTAEVAKTEDAKEAKSNEKNKNKNGKAKKKGKK